MGLSSSHGVPVPPGASGAAMLSAGVGGLSVPPDGFSACYVVPHMLTQCH